MSPRPRLTMTTALLLASLVTLPGTVLSRSVSPALSPEPNASIVFYKPPANGKPGRAVTGTLANGVFTKRGAFSTRRWTSIAVGRDSMALYDRGTGKLVTGKFRNGRWTPVKSRTIAKGYTHVVASCDTILFFKRPTSTGKTAEFTSGDIRDVRTLTGGELDAEHDYRLVDASCDTVRFHGTVSQTGEPIRVAYRSSRIDDGYYADFGRYERAANGLLSLTHQTANTDSYIGLAVPAAGLATGEGGTLTDGMWLPPAVQSDGFSRWDIIAGASDTILFYKRADGTTNRALLHGGGWTDLGPFPAKLERGWRIIEGGK